MRAHPSSSTRRQARDRWRALALAFVLPAGAAFAQTAGTPPATPPPELPPMVVQAIHETLQDEYRGQAFYQRFLNEHGVVRPFANIVRAEGRHASMLVALLEARGLTAPASKSVPAEAKAFVTRQEACAAAVTFEKENVALYDKHLAAEMPEDVRRVFLHNRDASLHHHLPAFERCAGTSGSGDAAAAVSGHRRSGGGRGSGPCRQGCGPAAACGHHGCGHGHGPGGCAGGGHHGHGCCGRGAIEPAPHH